MQIFTFYLEVFRYLLKKLACNWIFLYSVSFIMLAICTVQYITMTSNGTLWSLSHAYLKSNQTRNKGEVKYLVLIIDFNDLKIT